MCDHDGKWTLRIFLNGNEPTLSGDFFNGNEIKYKAFFLLDAKIKYNFISIKLTHEPDVIPTLKDTLSTILTIVSRDKYDVKQLELIFEDYTTAYSYAGKTYPFPKLETLAIRGENTPRLPFDILNSLSGVNAEQLIIESPSSDIARLRKTMHVKKLQLLIKPNTKVLSLVLDQMPNLETVTVPLSLLDDLSVTSMLRRNAKLNLEFARFDISKHTGITMFNSVRYVRVPIRVLQRLATHRVQYGEKALIQYSTDEFHPEDRKFMERVQVNLEGFLAFITGQPPLYTETPMKNFMRQTGDSAYYRKIFDYLHNANAPLNNERA